MKKPIFTGTCTALVTPFIECSVNYPMLEQLIRRQTEAGIKALVICGTTGESPVLSDSEKIELIQMSKRYAEGKSIIIAGTGSNSTEHAITLSQAAEKAGADALLVVSPYYNKATPEGLFIHYSAIAASVQIPIIIYNVPSRTGVDIPVDVYRQLAQIPNIIGVKEASTDILKILKIKAVCPPDFYIWSGNDDRTVPIMSLGGCGVISVLSNVLPKETIAMTNAALSGDYHSASLQQIRLYPLIEALFSETNPIPVKAAMKIIGYDCGICRLPLTPSSVDNYHRLEQLLK